MNTRGSSRNVTKFTTVILIWYLLSRVPARQDRCKVREVTQMQSYLSVPHRGDT